jgi:hypothetical protein
MEERDGPQHNPHLLHTATQQLLEFFYGTRIN